MNREILFRGKRVDNGEWVYGLLTHDLNDKTENCLSISPNWTTFNEVIPETVGQFTGLTDKNGTKIFEGDVCEFTDHPTGVESCKAKVVFSDGCFKEDWNGLAIKNYGTNWIKVTSNIHDDNPTT